MLDDWAEKVTLTACLHISHSSRQERYRYVLGRGLGLVDALLDLLLYALLNALGDIFDRSFRASVNRDSEVATPDVVIRRAPSFRRDERKGHGKLSRMRSMS